MVRLLHFCTALVVATIVIGINTPLALADSFNAVASVAAGSCSGSATLTQPGDIQLTCGSPYPPPFATFSANLGLSSGGVSYFGDGTGEFLEGKIDTTIDMTGEITAPGNSGISTITFEFEGSESQADPVGCSLTFDGQTSSCTVGVGFGILGTEDLQFVVENGQTYNYDLEVTADQYLIDVPSQATFQYSLPFVALVPEPVSVALVLSGFAPLAFRRKRPR